MQCNRALGIHGRSLKNMDAAPNKACGELRTRNEAKRCGILANVSENYRDKFVTRTKVWKFLPMRISHIYSNCIFLAPGNYSNSSIQYQDMPFSMAGIKGDIQEKQQRGCSYSRASTGSRYSTTAHCGRSNPHRCNWCSRYNAQKRWPRGIRNGNSRSRSARS